MQEMKPTGGGDFSNLHGELTGSLRLRLGPYRILFISNSDPCVFSVSGLAGKLIAEDKGRSQYNLNKRTRSPKLS